MLCRRQKRFLLSSYFFSQIEFYLNIQRQSHSSNSEIDSHLTGITNNLTTFPLLITVKVTTVTLENHSIPIIKRNLFSVIPTLI